MRVLDTPLPHSVKGAKRIRERQFILYVYKIMTPNKLATVFFRDLPYDTIDLSWSIDFSRRIDPIPPRQIAL